MEKITTQKQNIIAQGAEAKILKKGNKIIKNRVSKSYRIKILDESIRKKRTKSEAKILEKVNKIIPAPKVLKVEKTHIEIEFIDGKKLSEHLDEFALKEQKEIAKKIGTNIAKLHDSGIIHGDLTTSNMILSRQSTNSIPSNTPEKIPSSPKTISENNELVGSQVFFIDFGLGYHSIKQEDKAVDLHLLKQALEAKHFQYWKDLWKEIEKGYQISSNAKIVLERLRKVESRGRYKDKY